MFTEIDDDIFKFIGLLETKPLPKSNNSSENIRGIPLIYDLGEVQEFKLTQQDPTGSLISAFNTIGENFVGFGESNYGAFKECLSPLLDIPPFDRSATFQFIETHAFDWIINVHKNMRAEQTLSTYLLQCFEKENRDYTFYFVLAPLGLEGSLEFGGIEIAFLSDEFIQAEKEKLKKAAKEVEGSNDPFEGFKENVYVKVTGSGVRDKAKEIAFAKSGFAIDALRCLLYEYGIYNQHTMPDLEYRAYEGKASTVIHSYPSEQSTLEFMLLNRQGVAVLELGAAMQNKLKEEGLELFSSFVKEASQTDYCLVVRDAVTTFSRIVSVIDWHDRVAKLVAYFEAVLIDEKLKKGKGLTILKTDMLPKLLAADDVKIGGELGNYFYAVRDAFVHHGKRRPIDHVKLRQFQKIAFTFLRFLIRNRKAFNSMDDFYKYLAS